MKKPLTPKRSAEETKPIPCWCPYCGEPHGVDRNELPPKLRDPLKVMEQIRDGLPNHVVRVSAEELLASADQPPYKDMPPETDWGLLASSINKLQQASIEALVRRCKKAHHVDIVVRINGEYEVFQADWIKHLEKIDE